MLKKAYKRLEHSKNTLLHTYCWVNILLMVLWATMWECEDNISWLSLLCLVEISWNHAECALSSTKEFIREFQTAHSCPKIISMRRWLIFVSPTFPHPSVLFILMNTGPINVLLDMKIIKSSILIAVVQPQLLWPHQRRRHQVVGIMAPRPRPLCQPPFSRSLNNFRSRSLGENKISVAELLSILLWLILDLTQLCFRGKWSLDWSTTTVKAFVNISSRGLAPLIGD